MKRVLVVGDTLLDIYCRGEVNRISPEAPVVVFDQKSEETVLGGACNVAANIRSLWGDSDGLEIDYFGFYSAKVLNLLTACDVQYWGVPISTDQILTKKRFICGEQQMFRVDNHKKYFSPNAKEVLSLTFKSLDFNKYDLIVVSDYDKGTLDHREFEVIAEQKVPTIIDLKRIRLDMTNFKNNKDCILKCNLKEYDANPHMNMLVDESVDPRVVVTTGKNGYWFPKTEERFPTFSLQQPVKDVTGAGDVFLAGMGYSFLKRGRFDIRDMSFEGCASATVKVRHFGTKAVKRSEVDELFNVPVC